MTVVPRDMREWRAPEGADLVVSELLGSFADNELSPECLDGAQHCLKGGSWGAAGLGFGGRRLGLGCWRTLGKGFEGLRLGFGGLWGWGLGGGELWEWDLGGLRLGFGGLWGWNLG